MAKTILMPSLSPTMEEGVLRSWEKEIGAEVSAGELFAQIETDKAVVDYEILDDGFIRKYLVKAGETIKVGTPIAILTEIADETFEEHAPNVAAPPSSSQTPKVKEAPAVHSSHSSNQHFDYDVAVIGAGPGGYVSAIRASQLGLKVAIIDKRWLGGVCLNIGCIPTKALLANAELVHTVHQRSAEFGLNFKNFGADFGVAFKRSRATADQLTKGVNYLMRKNGISVHMAAAAFQDQHKLLLTNESGKQTELTAKHFIISTGASVRTLPQLPVDGETIVTYEEAILKDTLPKKVIVVGSGAIGVEFATIWNAYGVDVTILEVADRIVPNEDAEVSALLKKSFEKDGMRVLTNAQLQNVSVKDKIATLSIEQDGKEHQLSADYVLSAVGFVPFTQGLGLEKIGIALDNGRIVINSNMQTNVDNVYAIGDVTGKLMLAHVASTMGMSAIESIAGLHSRNIQYEMIPRATYCSPQIASMGWTEEQAKEHFPHSTVYQFPYSANGKALGIGANEGFIKIITDSKYGELIGAHMIGDSVTELLPQLTLAQANELTIEEIAHNIHAHPTLSETIMEAAHGATGGYIHI